MKTKLTLRLEKRLIERAKAHAKRKGMSVSQMVADYFKVLGENGDSKQQEETAEDLIPEDYENTAFTRELLGIAAGVDIGSGPKAHREEYYRHLAEKHR